MSKLPLTLPLIPFISPPHLHELNLTLCLLSLLPISSAFLKDPIGDRNDAVLDKNRPELGPSKTVVGEGILVILTASVISLGGRSRDLAIFDLHDGVAAAPAMVRGFPGASSHWNGIEAKVWSGGVNKPGGSGVLVGSEYKQSFGVEFGPELSIFEAIVFVLF